MSTRLIYGFHAIIAKLRQAPGEIREILLDEAGTDPVRGRQLAGRGEWHGIHPRAARACQGLAGQARGDDDSVGNDDGAVGPGH